MSLEHCGVLDNTPTGPVVAALLLANALGPGRAALCVRGFGLWSPRLVAKLPISGQFVSPEGCGKSLAVSRCSKSFHLQLQQSECMCECHSLRDVTLHSGRLKMNANFLISLPHTNKHTHTHTRKANTQANSSARQ